MFGSSLRRVATIAPADPAPMTMKSYFMKFAPCDTGEFRCQQVIAYSKTLLMGGLGFPFIYIRGLGECLPPHHSAHPPLFLAPPVIPSTPCHSERSEESPMLSVRFFTPILSVQNDISARLVQNDMGW